MTLQEAIDFFKSLTNETSKKAEMKVYDKFVYVLSELKKRTFTKEEIQSIEGELDSLNFKSNREDNIKFFKKAFSKFENFLKDTFSLTSKDYYAKLGIGLGSSFGLLFGIVFLSRMERSLGIALGLSIGMFIGLIIGRSMDAKAVRESKVL